jgi:peptidoglycan/xylan/chitin deacetylase (PgdA/CDA1 family)
MGDVLVLCYHAVSDRWPDDLAVRPESLRRQVAYALERGYEATTFTQAVTDPPSSRTVAVTFDDGYRSVVAHAFPVLAELAVPATLFVPTARIATEAPMSWPGIDHWLETPYRDELIGASWEEVAALAEAGWEIGSHSHTHPHLTQVDDTQLATELEASLAEIENRLGMACRSIAYPYGDVDERVVRAVGRAGYEAAAALPAGRFERRPRPLLWPRLMIPRGESDSAFRRHTSQPMRRLRSSAAWAGFSGVVSRSKSAVGRLSGR